MAEPAPLPPPAAGRPAQAASATNGMDPQGPAGGPPLILHYHIFKNAGSSVDAVLRSSFGGAWTGFEGTNAHDVQSAGDIARFLAAHPEVRALSTHLGRPPLPHAACLPIAFLRHPLLRARSVYEFVRHDPAQPDHGAAARDSFSGYVRWALASNDGGIVIRNYQVVHLSTASFRCPSILETEATEHDLDEACTLLAGWGMVGIVEEFARSAALFQHRYGPLAPGLDFQPVWHNRLATVRTAPVTELLEEVHDALGDELLARLQAANALDMRLYEFGRRLLTEAESTAFPERSAISPADPA